MQSVLIHSAGAQLVGEFHPAPLPAPAAFVVSHGWGSQAPADIPAALAAAGFPTVAYDLRGHARSTGDLASASRVDWANDLVAVHAWLRDQLPGMPIGLVGASFGAYLSLLAAQRCAVAGLSLRVPANFVDDGFAAPFLPRIGPATRKPEDLRPADSAALRALRAYSGPVQIVDADSDAVVPAETVAAYLACVPPDRLSHSTLRQAPHHLATPELRATYIDVLLTWATATFPS